MKIRAYNQYYGRWIKRQFMKIFLILKIILLLVVIFVCATPRDMAHEPKVYIYTAIRAELVDGEWIIYEGPNADL